MTTTLLGKSAFDETHSLSLGSTGLSSTDLVREWLDQCDAVFAIGASLTRTVFAPAIPPGKRFVMPLSMADLNKDYVADVPILGDASLVLTALLEELRSQHGKIGRPERGPSKRGCNPAASDGKAAGLPS